MLLSWPKLIFSILEITHVYLLAKINLFCLKMTRVDLKAKVNLLYLEIRGALVCQGGLIFFFLHVKKCFIPANM